MPLSEEVKQKLRDAGREDLIATNEILESGYAGVNKQGKSKKPHKMSMQQQIALQIREGKKRNPIDDIIGKWPGDESLEDLMQMLKDLD